jgi:hypothetical protein
MSIQSNEGTKLRKEVLNWGMSVLIQLYIGLVFLFFSIGMLSLSSSIDKHIYFSALIMLISMSIAMPFTFIFDRCCVKIKNWVDKSNRVKLLDGKGLILAIVLGEFLRRMGFLDHLEEFLGINSDAAIFVLFTIFFAFLFDKTNLVVETIIFLLGLIVFNIFEQQITTFYLVIFYLFMGIVFLTGGILDFRKFSKLSRLSNPD